MQVADDLNPIRVLALFSAISDEACELLDLPGRPENLIMTNLTVPPVTIRPSVEMDTGGGTNEDDITMKLMVRRSRYLLCCTPALVARCVACAMAAMPGSLQHDIFKTFIGLPCKQ